jgi:hypothetical protein
MIMRSELVEPVAVPTVLGPLYGLRTWTLIGERGAERVRGPYSGTAWPDGGAWLQATCRLCGVYGWHPDRRSARRTLAVRREVAGIVETRGAVAVHADGFRAQEGRPHAFVLHPRSNPHMIRRLASVYEAGVVEVRGADALLAWCLEHDAGLSASGLEALGVARRPHRRRRR